MISVPRASHKTNAVLIQGMDTLREINKIQLTSLLYMSTIHKSNCYDLLLCMCISVTKSMAHIGCLRAGVGQSPSLPLCTGSDLDHVWVWVCGCAV